jgi:TRAP-type C4-dicarboxylate transport system substrate-binding protein
LAQPAPGAPALRTGREILLSAQREPGDATQRAIHRALGFALRLLALILLWGMLLAVAVTAQTRVKLGTLAPRGTSYHQALQGMGEKWRQAPAGGVALTIYPDGTMGSEADMVRRMRVGQLQAALLTVNGLSEIEPDVGALQKMPLVYRSLEELEFVSARLQPQLEKRMLDHGFVVLFWADAGWVRFFSRKPVTTPEELKKLKMFVTAGDNTHIEIMKSGGYQPVMLEWADALTSLQTGMVDVIPSTPFYGLAGQFYTVAPHMLEINWAPLAGALVITRKSWEGLPVASREALLAAAHEAGKTIQARGRAESADAVEAMKKRGLKVHTLTPQAAAEWERAISAVYPRIRGSMVPADIYDEVQRLLKEYRAQPAAGSAGGRA